MKWELQLPRLWPALWPKYYAGTQWTGHISANTRLMQSIVGEQEPAAALCGNSLVRARKLRSWCVNTHYMHVVRVTILPSSGLFHAWIVDHTRCTIHDCLYPTAKSLSLSTQKCESQYWRRGLFVTGSHLHVASSLTLFQRQSLVVRCTRSLAAVLNLLANQMAGFMCVCDTGAPWGPRGHTGTI